MKEARREVLEDLMDIENAKQILKRIEEKKAGSDAVMSMQKAYNEFVIDQKERYNELKEELNYVRGELKEVKEESKSLRDEVRTWKTKYNSLKREFDKYRKVHE